jgi:hypothetical protein
MPDNSGLQDDLLDNLVGNWRIVRDFPKRKSENDAKCEWLFNHQFLRIHMRDINEPPNYEAMVFIGFNAKVDRYVGHWIDVFGGEFSETLGLGKRNGNSIEFLFKYPDGQLTNVFTYRPEADSWISQIDQQDDDRNWGPFCTDTYTRR